MMKSRVRARRRATKFVRDVSLSTSWNEEESIIDIGSLDSIIHMQEEMGNFTKLTGGSTSNSGRRLISWQVRTAYP